MFSEDNSNPYTPPRKYLDLMRWGYSGGNKRVRIGKQLSVRPFDDGRGYEIDYDLKLALNLTSVLVQQGWDDDRIKREHMKLSNVGFCWVRRQSDPEATSAALIAKCDRSKKPMVPTKDRHEKILGLLRTGEIVSQKKLIKHVGNVRDSYTQADIVTLAEAGAIVVETVQHGTSKYGAWKRIYLAVSVAEFREISYSIRRGLAKMIARREWIKRHLGKAKGFRRLTVGTASKPLTPLTELENLEIDLENQLRPPMTIADVLSDMFIDERTARKLGITRNETYSRTATGNRTGGDSVRAGRDKLQVPNGPRDRALEGS